MPRSIWKGMISFGMVSIPVNLYAATESKDVAFHQLHKTCNSRIRQKRWCPACDREVSGDEIVRGYEYVKGEYVVVDDEELAALPVPSKHTIELVSFVKADELAPTFHEKSYFLEPDPAGVKPYALLTRALKKKGLTGLASIALRSRERLCALRVEEGALVLDTLFHADEVRDRSRPQVPDVLVSERELDLAYHLIDALAEPFAPEKYQDRYRGALLELIEAKVQGREAVRAPDEPPPTPTDLMDALRASITALRKEKPAEPKTARRPARRKRAA